MSHPDAVRYPSPNTEHDAILITSDLHTAETLRDVVERGGLRLHWEPQPQAALDLVQALRPRCVIFDSRTDLAGGFHAVANAVARVSPTSTVLSVDHLGGGRYALGTNGTVTLRSARDQLTPRHFAKLALHPRPCSVAEPHVANGDPVHLDGHARSVDLHGAPLLLSNAEFDVLQALVADRRSHTDAELEAIVRSRGSSHVDPVAAVIELDAKLEQRSTTARIAHDSSTGWRLESPTCPSPLTLPAGEYATASTSAEVTVHGRMTPHQLDRLFAAAGKQRRRFDRVSAAARSHDEHLDASSLRLGFVIAIEQQDALDRALDLLRAESLPHTVELTQLCEQRPPR